MPKLLASQDAEHSIPNLFLENDSENENCTKGGSNVRIPGFPKDFLNEGTKSLL